VIIGYLPIVLISTFAGTLLIVLNPGLFWDDWVWWFQSPESNIRISKELGVWWGGYLSNVIYAVKDPVLLLRLVALLFWIIFDAAFVYVAGKIFYFDEAEYVEIFVLIASCHVSLIRFINSVALYNTYIAFFWLGCAVLVTYIKKSKQRFYSLPLFFLSFYLNSMISLYGLVLIGLFVFSYRSQLRAVVDESGVRDKRFRATGVYVEVLRRWVALIRVNALAFTRREWLFIALPVIFMLQKRFLLTKSYFYDDYNSIRFDDILNAIFKTFRIISVVFRDYFRSLYRDVPFIWTVLGVIIVLIAVLFIRYGSGSTDRRIAGRVGFSLLLAYFALFPYVVVGKTPHFLDFYESRHGLIVIPAIILFLHTVVISLCTILCRGKVSLVLLRKAFLTLLVGSSLGSTVHFAYQLWGDWYRQKAIIDYLGQNRVYLEDARLLIFEDNVPLKSGGRIIWNYEYTGMVVAGLGGRSRMGVSLQEYQSWPKSIELLNKRHMKERFNMAGFTFGDGSPIVCIRTVLKGNGFREYNMIDIINRRLSGAALPDANHYISVDSYRLNTQADSRVKEMSLLLQAIYEYRLDHGSFPVTDSTHSDSQLSLRVIRPDDGQGHISVSGVIDDIPALFPHYARRPALMNRELYPESYYFYQSDGIDFKLLYVSYNDIAFVKQAYPSMIDKIRPANAYGFWTKGAVDW
jgi:hypothetical protein